MLHIAVPYKMMYDYRGDFMQQYFYSKRAQINDYIVLNDEQAHHVSHVLRMRENDVVRIVDKENTMFFAHLLFEGKKVIAHLDQKIEDHTRNAVRITLLQGMIKKEKWDYVLQKSAELGVDCIVPFTSSRTVVKAKEERMDKKLLRWNKILLEACEQCKRSTLVDLKEPCLLKDAARYKSELNIIAYEDAGATSEKLHRLLAKYPKISSVTIAIGSEGGFSKEEVSMLMEMGYHRVSLGARILRAETAALAAIHGTSFYYDMAGDKQ